MSLPTFRPVGDRGERYPAWLRALSGKSGVYIVREAADLGRTLYVGESHTGKLYGTITRHFQRWLRSSRSRSALRFQGARGGWSPGSRDPGVTYPREDVVVAVIVRPADRAVELQGRLIDSLCPRDNLDGAEACAVEGDLFVPF